MPDLVLHLDSLSLFSFLLFFLRLSWSSELLHGKLKVCLGTSGLAAGNLKMLKNSLA